jgi:phosphopantetheinyl transferase
MGLDAEKVQTSHNEALSEQLTSAELAYLQAGDWPFPHGLTRLWTAKEALGKTIRTGLMTPLSIYETQNWTDSPGESRCDYRNFGQYRGLSFFIGDFACSVCHPANTQVAINRADFNQILQLPIT